MPSARSTSGNADLARALGLQLMAIALEQGGNAVGDQAHARAVAHILMHHQPHGLALQVLDRSSQLQQRRLFRRDEAGKDRKAGARQ